MTKKPNLVSAIVDLLLPWIVLLFIGYSTFALFVLRPYIGFHYTNNRSITEVYTQSSQPGLLQPGDLLLRVGNVSYEQVKSDLRKAFFENVKAGDTIEIEVERNGKRLTIPYTIRGFNAQEVFGRLNNHWFMPYIFWLAGAASFLFLRPRNTLRWLLGLFCFVTAAWLSTGLFSGIHLWNYALYLRSLIWISVPVYLHLHWLFPRPLRPLPKWVWGLIYALSGLIAIIEWLQLVPESFYLIGFIAALLGSFILLLVHVISQPAERRVIRGLIAAVGLALIPVVIVAGIGAAGINLEFEGIVILGLAGLPGFYFYSLYRLQLRPGQQKSADRTVRLFVISILSGLLFCLIFVMISQLPLMAGYIPLLTQIATLILLVIALINFAPFLVLPALGNERIVILPGGPLSFSANRLAPTVFFVLLELMIILLAAIVLSLFFTWDFPLAPLVIAVIFTSIGSIYGFAPFKRVFERVILGAKITPEDTINTFSERITTSLETQTLRHLLLEEVMPSLFIRQFAHLHQASGHLSPLSLLKVTPDMLVSESSALQEACGKWISADEASSIPAWIRLVLPVQVGNNLPGFWLFGQRDPDDFYSPEDIQMLRTLANQTALALVNIEQAENLRALYRADMDRHEVERAHLAAELHDDVLNQMALLNQRLPDGDPEAQASYDQAVQRIRDIINGLRPAMLNFGLAPALQSLADDMNDRLPQGPRITLDLPISGARFGARHEPRVELALFRIVQQACQNAVQHAQCRSIHISGRIDEGRVDLLVQDDGVGFSGGKPLNLAALLADKHFGLAGMFERAALIGAHLQVDSTPGEGSRVRLAYLKN